MTKMTQYVTQRMIEDFLIPYYRSTGNRLRFQDAIEKMQEQGLLSEEPLPVPELRWEQPTPEFRETFLHLPFDAAKIAAALGSDINLVALKVSDLSRRGHAFRVPEHKRNFLK